MMPLDFYWMAHIAFDSYEKALKDTLLNRFAMEIPDNKIQEVNLEAGLKELNYLPGTIMDYASI